MPQLCSMMLFNDGAPDSACAWLAESSARRAGNRTTPSCLPMIASLCVSNLDRQPGARTRAGRGTDLGLLAQASAQQRQDSLGLFLVEMCSVSLRFATRLNWVLSGIVFEGMPPQAFERAAKMCVLSQAIAVAVYEPSPRAKNSCKAKVACSCGRTTGAPVKTKHGRVACQTQTWRFL